MSFARVVFPERTPTSVGFFDYQIPKNLEKTIGVGFGVLVPFRNSKKDGVVMSITERTDVPQKRIKEISKLTTSTPLVTKKQLALVQWIQDVTGSSYGTILKSLIADKPKRATYPDFPKEICIESRMDSTVYIYDAEESSVQEVEKICGHHKDTQVVVVAPDVYAVQKIAGRLKNSNDVFVFSGTLSLTKRFDFWLNCRKGKSGVYIGTRSVLLLPFLRLSNVLLLHEDDVTHQRIDQHPDVDTRFLVQKLSELHHARAHFFSPAPSFYTIQKAFTQPYWKIKRITHPTAKIKIINTDIFRAKRQSSILPLDLIEHLKTNDGNFFLLYNRKGFYRKITCKECGWELVCTKCKSNFIIESGSRDTVICRVCKTSTHIPPMCPSCANPQIQFSYPGIEELHRRIQKEIPLEKISLITKESSDRANARITIGTLFALQKIDWSALSGFLLLDTDLSLGFPDFRSTEWLSARIRTIVAHLPISATCYILSSHTEHSALQGPVQSMPRVWYMQELKERQTLHYPPFSQLFKLSRLEQDFARNGHLTTLTIKKITDFFEKTTHKIDIVELEPVPRLRSGKYHSVLLLRIYTSDPDQHMKNLELLCGADWKITSNPLDLSS